MPADKAERVYRYQKAVEHDIGIIAQGYCLNIQGENQRLEIRSWVTQDNRSNTKLEHTWKPDTWYTMKLTAEPQSDGSCKVMGKVWKKDDEEPEAWTIEVTDPRGNMTGSPGLYMYQQADSYFDNIKVTLNK